MNKLRAGRGDGELWEVRCGMLDVKSGMWNVGCGMWNVECERAEDQGGMFNKQYSILNAQGRRRSEGGRSRGMFNKQCSINNIQCS